MDLAQITKQLEQAKSQKARLEGRKEQLLKNLSSLGFDSVEAAKAEQQKLREFLETAEPNLKEQYDAFVATHGQTLEALKGAL